MKNRFANLKNMQLDTDYLTGLLNRRALHDVWDVLPSSFELHCIYLDIDNFKLVNDVYGHSKGDELLVFVAAMLQRIFKDQIIARMGGDEFCILCNGELPIGVIEEKFPLMQDEFAMADFGGSIESVLSFSIGVIYHQPVVAGLGVILNKCDDAMYYMKKHGKKGFINYDTISTMLEEQKAIKNRARYALENDEISILLNPIMFLQTSEVDAVEVVLEWKFPSLGILSEDRFLPVFEQYGTILQMNTIMFEKVCEWKHRWKDTPFESLDIYIKLSLSFLMQKEGMDFIEDCLNHYDVTAREIVVGIEEQQFVENNARIGDILKKLKSLGLRVGIDDFGILGSTYVLTNIKRGILKLDQKLLDEANRSAEGKLILRNTISLARDLRCSIIGQGIQNSSDIAMLTNYGAQTGVGTFYGTPLREVDFCYKYKSSLLGERNIKPVIYQFKNSLNDMKEEYISKPLGVIPEFVPGVADGITAIHMKGGRIKENIVLLQKDVMYSDSYSISFWLNTDKKQPWTSLLYIPFADGFVSIVPINGEAGFTFRIKDDREPNIWHDLNGPHAVPGSWHYVCVTYDALSGIASLYFNGLPVQTLDNVPCLKVPKAVILGGDDFQVSYEGKIAELSFYHYAMTSENVKRRMDEYRQLPGYVGPLYRT